MQMDRNEGCIMVALDATRFRRDEFLCNELIIVYKDKARSADVI